MLITAVYSTLFLVISQRRQTKVKNVNFFTSSDSHIPLPEEIADLTRLWAALSRKNRKALLVFAQLQAAATAPPPPLDPPRLH
ncbi:hypothetical protein ACLF3G_27555 [Falsiroseomonas sp. HC035]|uniref:hypothetical protein n=1 Tax=Falsiroseomonas sp. HC035 TaxID=3390999 RepID=UPI003D32296E